MAPKARVQKRLYYKIGEACKALGIQPYVLRYWETEFSALSPSKSRSGQRVYSEKELEVIRRIKQLLYDEGYTIAGAKKKLDAELAAGTLGESATAATVNGPGVFQTVSEPRGHPHRPAAPPAAGVGLAATGGAATGGAGADGTAAGPIAVRSGDLPLTAVPGDADAAHGRADRDAKAAGMEAKAQSLAGMLRAPAPAATVAPPGEPQPPGAPARSRAATARPSGGPAAPAQEGASQAGSPEEGGAPQEAAAAAAAAGISGPAWPVPPTLPLVSPADPGKGRPGAAPGAPPGPPGQGPADLAVLEDRSAEEQAGAPSAERGVRPGPQAVRAPASASGTAAPGDLDTTAAKQVETFRKGIQKALQEAREILALLDSRSPR
jgi:DNA-binding transcriptional MerR regulator